MPLKPRYEIAKISAKFQRKFFNHNSFLKITIADGNGAGFFWSSNFSLPLINLISVAFIQYSCHHVVSVRLGIRRTTVLPFFHSSNPLRTHLGSSLPYGGLTKLIVPHSFSRPSILNFGGQGS